MNEQEILTKVDQLLAAAAADPDQQKALLSEALALLRTIREQREIDAMPASIRYLYDQQKRTQ